MDYGQSIDVRLAGEGLSKREEKLKKWYGTKEERLQEARWLVVKNMLESFPKLRERVRK